MPSSGCLFVCFHTRSPGAGIIGSQEESQGTSRDKVSKINLIKHWSFEHVQMVQKLKQLIVIMNPVT